MPAPTTVPGGLQVGNEESITGYNEVKQPNYDSGNGLVGESCAGLEIITFEQHLLRVIHNVLLNHA